MSLKNIAARQDKGALVQVGFREKKRKANQQGGSRKNKKATSPGHPVIVSFKNACK
jgi:hypothetical protein